MTVTVERSQARRVCDFEDVPEYSWFFFAGRLYIKIRSSSAQLVRDGLVSGSALVVETRMMETFEDSTLVTPVDVAIYYKEKPAREHKETMASE